MDNPKGSGKRIYLCKTCHNTLHIIISSLLWEHIAEHEKQNAIEHVERFTKFYVGKDNIEYNSTLDILDAGIKICPNCGMQLDIEDKYCEYCSETCSLFEPDEYEPK